MRKYKLDQTRAPLVEKVIEYIGQNRLPFHMPGHMRGGVIPEPLAEWFGEGLYKFDLTEVQGLDYLHTSSGVIGEAQKYAADAFGVRETKFLINGTTVGVQAMMLSSVWNEEKII
ncbi:MAG TPA: arginine decarboxylase, partial [Caldisericia bacterium]|nr:arginine decarboxylase [Caldisericia bacterium]